MKKFLTFAALVSLAAGFISCNNESDVPGAVTPSVGDMVHLRITASNPESFDTRTMVGDDGKTPLWSPEDAIGVSVFVDGAYTNYEFSNESSEPSEVTTFAGMTAVSDVIYTYFPYTAGSVNSDGEVLLAIPAGQHPAAASFDGSADLLVGKPVPMTASTGKIEGLQFKRVGAFLKIVLDDQSGMLEAQKVKSLSVTAAGNLAGGVRLDIVNGELSEIYADGSRTVTATYTDDTQYPAVGGAAFLGVYPQTLASGSALTVSVVTDSYEISRTISLQSDIELSAGKITTLTVKIDEENFEEKQIVISEAFPDPIFRQYVLDNFDTDKDGFLSAQEAAAVTHIEVAGTFSQPNECASLEGIR